MPVKADKKDNYKIKVQDVTKEYDMFKTQSDKLKSFFSISKHIPHFWALMGVSFEVKPGETLGVIGVNGSGKSTISDIISGIIPQTTGYVDVRGDTSIVAIGAGLKQKLTGRENIRLKSLMQGLTNKQVDKLMPDIIKFADIGYFVDQPVKNYSSGMKSRLGFSIAVHINPDILIIDEALSVGDSTFYGKCLDRIKQFKKSGKTIIFVSHNLSQVSKLCDRVVWINYGVLKDICPTKKVVGEYKQFTKNFKKKSKKQKSEFENNHRAIREHFNIHKYEQSVIDETKKQYPAIKKIPAKTHKLFYGSVLNEKMPWTTRILTVIIMFFILIFGLSNIAGYSFPHFVKDPTSIAKPSKVLKIPNNQINSSTLGHVDSKK